MHVPDLINVENLEKGEDQESLECCSSVSDEL